MRNRPCLSVGLSLLLTLGEGAIAEAPPPPAAMFSNPVVGPEGGADPAVLLHNDTYYFYSTNPDNAVFLSKDLVHWRKGPQILPESFKGVWAPEVYHHPEDGKFYLYYTKRYKIGVAVSDQPDALFTDLGILAVPGIDAHPFRDDDGRLYLYFTHTPPFTMYCVPMRSPTETGGPVMKCFEISQDWERHSFAINEGPWMEKRDGRYTMLYSGSNGQSVHYAVGIATAPTPIGPFTKYAQNPVFQDKAHVFGPGHGSVVRDRAGALWHLYHQKTDASVGWNRDICLDPLAYDGDGVLRGKPTRGVSQAVPVTDPNVVWSPDIHPRGAVFNASVTVSLSSRTLSSQIRYTVDGTDPSSTSRPYDQPFPLTETTTVRARAYKEGMVDSAASAMRFTRTDDQLPVNPAPNGVSEAFPFDVFPSAVIDWRKHAAKPINLQPPKGNSGQ